MAHEIFKIYRTYIRPKLEYTSAAWFPDLRNIVVKCHVSLTLTSIFLGTVGVEDLNVALVEAIVPEHVVDSVEGVAGGLGGEVPAPPAGHQHRLVAHLEQPAPRVHGVVPPRTPLRVHP